MVVFGSKSSSSRTKLFEQPLEKLFNPKAIKQFNETVAASNSRSPPALCQSLSAPLTSSTLTWAKLSSENSAAKRKRAAARLRRFTIDANNNSPASLITTITSAPLVLAAGPAQERRAPTSSSIASQPGEERTGGQHLAPAISHPELAQHNERLVGEEMPAGCDAGELERCRLLLQVLPEPIRCLLNEIYLRGPSTVGIFRKSPNAKHCKELRQKLEAAASSLNSAGAGQAGAPSCQSSVEEFQVNVIASVFKEWLRSLPDCLLMSRLYPQWIDVAKLIEPLHQHKQAQQQQQGANEQQVDDKSAPSGRTRERHPGEQMGNSARQDARPATMTDNAGQELAQHRQVERTRARTTTEGESDSPAACQQKLSRALSCSVMTNSSADSGHSSSSSPSPSSATCSSSPRSTSFDAPAGPGRKSPGQETIERVSRARAAHFTPAQQANNSSTPRASYLKRKCFQQQQRSEKSSCSTPTATSQADASSSGHLSSPASSPGAPNRSQTSGEFSLGERRLECLRVVRQLLEALNETNLILLRAIICVLWHIADRAEHNKMSSGNLGVCVGQSLLNDEHQQRAQHHGGSPTGAGRHTSRLHTFSFTPPGSSATGGGGTKSGGLRADSSSSPQNSTAQSALRHLSLASNFTKRHRRARSQSSLLASTLSLTNLSHLSTSSSPTGGSSSPPAPHGANHLSGSISSNYLDSSGAQETAKYVPILVAFMIDHARELFGSDVMNLFGPARPLEPEVEPAGVTLEVGVAGVAEETEKSNPQTEPTEGACRDEQNPRGVERPSAAPKQHRRHLSTSVLVHIGSGPGKCPFGESSCASDRIAAEGSAGDIPSETGGPTETTRPDADGETTTSILIVNAGPGKQPRPEEQKEATSCHGHEGLAPKPDSPSGESGCLSSLENVDARHQVEPATSTNRHDDEEEDRDRCLPPEGEQQPSRPEQQQQQRPLSATESTGSSSRASSSTSGVHSESPAFSCEPDSSSSSSGSSSSSRQCRARTTTTCSSSSANSSRSASVSSPSSSSGPSVCTSPLDVELGVVERRPHHRSSPVLAQGGEQANEAVQVLHLSRNEALRHNLLARDQVDGPSAAPMPTERISLVRAGANQRPRLLIVHQDQQQQQQQASRLPPSSQMERPKSMVSLADVERLRQQQVAVAQQHQQEQHRQMSLLMGSKAGVAQHPPFDVTQSANSRQVVQQRVVTQHQQAGVMFRQQQAGHAHQQQQRQSQTLNRFSSASSGQLPSGVLVCPERMPKIPFQYTTSCYGGEAVLFYPPCTQHQVLQQQQGSLQGQHRQAATFQRGHQQAQQQQQQPQRSHVMMLRDYYLSLQERSQKEQQYRDFLRRQHEQQRLLQAHQHQLQSQANPHAGMAAVEQPVHQQRQCIQEQPAAVAYQRIQPRLARIRPNQFNGLYVKSAHEGQTERVGGGGSALAAVSQSSISQQSSSKMSSSSSSAEHSPFEDEEDEEGEVCASSDECSTGEWMESTMV